MRKHEIDDYRRNIRRTLEKYKHRTFRNKDELNEDVRKFMNYGIPKRVRLALMVKVSGKIDEKMITMVRNIAIGKQHWMYKEFVEHNGYIVPIWYANAKIEDSCS
jgi:hypothetical protein